MADRTFESQQYASQEAARGEAALSGGISSLAGAAQVAGAAMERQADRTEQKRQFDVQAGLRQEEMQFQRDARLDDQAYRQQSLGEQSRQFNEQFALQKERQAADLNFRRQVENRLIQGQLTEQEDRRLRTMLEWQAQQAAQSQFLQQFSLEKDKLAVLSDAKARAAATKQLELENEARQIEIEARKAQSADAYRRGRLGGMSLDSAMRYYDATATLYQKLTAPDAIGVDKALVEDLAERLGQLGRVLTRELSGESMQPEGPPQAPPPATQPATQAVSQQANQLLSSSIRSPGNSDPASSRVAMAMLRLGDNGSIEFKDDVAFSSYSSMVQKIAGAAPPGVDTKDLVVAINRQIDAMMAKGMTLTQAVEAISRAGAK